MAGKVHVIGIVTGLGLLMIILIISIKPSHHFVMAGIGTFPGGQSTGGYSEFDFERPEPEQYKPRHTAQESEYVRKLDKRWIVVAGPCKGVSDVEELRKCSKSRQPKWADDFNVASKRTGNEYALMKPASAGVDVNSRNPSLENVIRANKLPNLKPIYGKIKTLQDQLNVIKNPRNLDTEDLTSETNDDWMGQTANLCCINMYDTVCNQPCGTY